MSIERDQQIKTKRRNNIVPPLRQLIMFLQNKDQQALYNTLFNLFYTLQRSH